MGLITRRIFAKGTNDLIELVGSLDVDRSISNLELYINGDLQDSKISVPIGSFLGCTLTLHGSLAENVPVMVTLKTHFFMKPEYRFYVREQQVHKEKGTWGMF